jgi:hypothetical protein
MEVIFSSFVTLKDILIILVFFFTVAAIIGQQIFNGLFKNRCVDLSTVEIYYSFYKIGNLL